MSNDKKISELKGKRKTFKTQLTRFKTFIEKHEKKMNLTELSIRYEKIKKSYTDFEIVHFELESLDVDHDHSEEMLEIENDFFVIAAKAHDLLYPKVAKTASSSVIDGANSNTIQQGDENDIFLPKINLPIFSGNYEEWPGFSDQFKNSVHENTKISSCKKLTYLKSCLKGEASKVIESLNNTEENYAIAWSLLEKRYNQPAIIVTKHIKAIFQTQSITKANYKDLRDFLNNIESHYRALQALEQPSADTIFIYLLLTKLDNDTICKWKEHKSDDFPKLKIFFDFLHDRCKVLEPLVSDSDSRYNPRKHENSQQRYHNPNNKFSQKNTQHSYAAQVNNKIVCAICKNPHFTQNCDQFIKVDVNERFKLIKNFGLCSNCLRSNHLSNECKASLCKKCNKKHHTLLHIESQNTPSTSAVSSISSLQAVIQSQTLLSTILASILDNDGIPHQCRILIDNGSQSNFLTEAFVSKLNLKKSNVDVSVSGIQQLAMPVKHSVTATIKSLHNEFTLSTNFLILPKLSERLPSHYIDKNILKVPKNIKLADPDYNKPGDVDAILGSSVFHKLICVGKISLLNDDVALLKTQFGWIFCGELHNNRHTKVVSVNLSVLSLQHQISKFWEIEENFSKNLFSKEEDISEHHYQNNTSRDPFSGRFIVRLPFKDNKDSLGDSHTMALKRFYSLEKSLSKNSLMKEQYINFIREYSLLNHMTEVKNPNKYEGYYLPHHAVIKNSSNTTKLRVVFDGSAATSTGISLNDTLNVGPVIQEDLFTILLRFRSHSFVLTADIAKMYRQVLIHPEDRKFQKILWRDDSSKPIKTFELNTLTYGTTPASYLAIKSLHQIAEIESKLYPLASRVIKEDFYVDDLLTGTQTYEDTIKLRNDLIHILSKGGFQIRQWLSNDKRITSDLQNQSNDQHFCLNFDQTSKVLGVQWQPSKDIISYSLQNSNEKRLTKRIILSQIAQLFDPLGLLGPIIVRAKLIMQRLWQSKISWDESVPLEIHTLWNNFRTQLPIINQINFPRNIIDNNAQIQLHGFCDASEKAYGACIYTRCVTDDGQISVKLICSKSRVAPLKTISLPRLELCACLLLIKLLEATCKSLRRVTFEKIILWSDSTIALTWISTSPNTLQTFVANRVAEIQSCAINHKWRHIVSENNPADVISRGCMPSDFLDSRSWKQGPNFFCDREENWPALKFQISEIPELRKIVSLKTTAIDIHLFERFSSFNRAKRIIALCLRFMNNCKYPQSKRIGNITINEINDATTKIIHVVQLYSFPEFFKIKSGCPKNTKTNLSSLNPFVDINQILRVGGRITLSNIPYEGKHPALLPRKNHITNLIIREEHLKNFHSGAQSTLASIRQRYWITDGRNAVRNILRKCIKCFHVNPPISQYIMGNLPKARVTYSRPFLHTGIDYCGPFFVKEKTFRNRGKIKVYIAIFVCLSTKAIHIEVVSDLTTEAFLAALRRFFSRRGKSTDLYSDNAKNFIGANNHFKEIYKIATDHENNERVNKFITAENIVWHFSPPHAPHFGGIWEAAVRSFKNHFYRIACNTLLSYESLNTLCIEIEGILNSRPLTPLTSDPNDFLILTPGHFLIGTALTCTPERDLSNIADNRLNIWQQIQKLRNHFWKRWHKDYLHELIVRRKWHNGGTKNVEVGELVLLREENLPPMSWKLGRIIQTHPGEDQIVRVVTVKTVNGEYKRSVKHISPLPIEQ